MTLLYVLCGMAVLAATLAIAGAVRRSRRHRVVSARMAERLRQSYGPSGSVVEPVSLAAPPGEAAVDETGLHVRIGTADGLRHVPWSGVQSVTSAPRERCAVHISGVGVVVVPSVLGRRIWDTIGRVRAAEVERARSARV